LAEIPFSSARKAMSVVYKTDNKTYSYVKGAPENIIKACSSIVIDGKVLKLDQTKKADLMEIERKMAGEPLRVLALAYKEVPKKDKYSDKETETDLTFVGLVGMVDPPRTEVVKAIENAHAAGIRTVMITGDHKTTAVAIAKQIGIMESEDIAVTGIELDAMTDEELEEIIEHISVYARVSPEHKVKILDMLMKTGNVVAMTGDGVNDAPALKRSDIGVSMGIKGTDVAKEASDIILQDDNYATIVKAVESGRGIYDNIRKVIKYMVSMNFMELFTVAVIAFAGFPVPLLPLQILWINLVTDSLPGIALAVDVNDPDIMKRVPRKKGESVFSGGILYFIIAAATLGTLVGVGLFFFSLKGGIAYARTMVFTLSVMLQMIFVFNCRSESKSVFRTNPFSNLKLLGTVVLTIMLQIFVVQLPFFQEIFKTVPLTLWDWGLVASLSVVGLAISPLFFTKPEESST
jgi:Ca2+-transporting ATPase